MRIKSRSILGLPAVVAVTITAFAGIAGADVITARFDAITPGRGMTVSTNAGATYHGTTGGTFRWTRLGGDYSGPGADGQFETYCIDIDQSLAYGHTYDFDVTDPEVAPLPGPAMGAARATLLAELFGRFYVPEFATNNLAGAFQVAVWEIAMDDGLDLSDGTFRLDDAGSLATIAQGWLDALDGTGPHAQLLAMTNPSVQDQVFMVPGASSAGLMLIGGLFGCSSRRRRNVE